MRRRLAGVRSAWLCVLLTSWGCTESNDAALPRDGDAAVDAAGSSADGATCCQDATVDAAARDGGVRDGAPRDSAPADGAFGDAALADGAFGDARPASDGAPIDAAPVDGTPVDAAPVDGAPIDAAPADAAPADGAPVDGAPADAAPADAAPADMGPPDPDAGACRPGAVFCVDDDVRRCRPDGTGDDLVEACGDAGCADGRCASVCGDRAVAGDETCDDGNDDACDGCDACQRRAHVVLERPRHNYVEFDDAGAPLTLADTPFTVEFWARLDVADGRVDVDRRGPPNRGWRLAAEPGRMVATLFGVADTVVPVPTRLGHWHHYAWTWDGEQAALFFDGLETRRFRPAGPVGAVDAPVRLGAIRDADGFVERDDHGLIDEVRLSRVARYDGDFVPRRRFAPDADTLALWHLDEGEGEHTADASGHGHDGRFLAARWGDDDAFGGRFCGPACADGQCGLVDFVPLDGGAFTMGGPEADAMPAHDVEVPPFEIGRTEVTMAQLRACLAAGRCEAPHWEDGTCDLFVDGARGLGRLPDTLRGLAQPAVCLTRAQATAFAAWVGARLPSESEWEYAARGGGRDVIYPWGDQGVNCQRAVMFNNGAGCGAGRTAPACSLPAGHTPQGLCDMSGNAREMVADTWHASYEGAPDDGSPWLAPPAGIYPTRGGAWNNGQNVRLTVYNRGPTPNDLAADYLGFRVAR